MTEEGGPHLSHPVAVAPDGTAAAALLQPASARRCRDARRGYAMLPQPRSGGAGPTRRSFGSRRPAGGVHGTRRGARAVDDGRVDMRGMVAIGKSGERDECVAGVSVVVCFFFLTAAVVGWLVWMLTECS
jgi:hypothetical protein